jgi:hypothetical protein
VHFGLEYMTEKKADVGVRNFPGLGDVATLSWDGERIAATDGIGGACLNRGIRAAR